MSWKSLKDWSTDVITISEEKCMMICIVWPKGGKSLAVEDASGG